jgi:hypothetical protein
MADTGTPATARIDGAVHHVELIAWVRTRHGAMARVCWREKIGDSVHTLTITVPAAAVYELPGVDYGDVPVVEGEQRRGGRVASGWDWRRTG